eukprot:g6635.t1
MASLLNGQAEALAKNKKIPEMKTLLSKQAGILLSEAIEAVDKADLRQRSDDAIQFEIDTQADGKNKKVRHMEWHRKRDSNGALLEKPEAYVLDDERNMWQKKAPEAEYGHQGGRPGAPVCDHCTTRDIEIQIRIEAGDGAGDARSTQDAGAGAAASPAAIAVEKQEQDAGATMEVDEDGEARTTSSSKSGLASSAASEKEQSALFDAAIAGHPDASHHRYRRKAKLITESFVDEIRAASEANNVPAVQLFKLHARSHGNEPPHSANNILPLFVLCELEETLCMGHIAMATRQSLTNAGVPDHDGVRISFATTEFRLEDVVFAAADDQEVRAKKIENVVREFLATLSRQKVPLESRFLLELLEQEAASSDLQLDRLLPLLSPYMKHKLRVYRMEGRRLARSHFGASLGWAPTPVLSQRIADVWAAAFEDTQRMNEEAVGVYEQQYYMLAALLESKVARGLRNFTMALVQAPSPVA